MTDSDLAVFRCPSALEDWAGKSDYGGNYGSSLTGLTPGFQRGFGWESGTLPPMKIQMPGDYRRDGVRFGEMGDGASQTFLVLEDADRPPRKAECGATAITASPTTTAPSTGKSPTKFLADIRAVRMPLLADGSSRFLSEATDLLVLGALATRGHGEVISQP